LSLYRASVLEAPTIRRAELDDVETIVRHGARMFESMGARDLQWVPVAERALRDGLQHERMVAVVAEDPIASQRLVSSAVAVLWQRLPTPWNETGSSAYVQYVWTEPEHRRRGIARRVLDELIRSLRDAGVAGVDLNAAPMAQSLYAAEGFKPSRNPAMHLDL
jgi:ribosomal protein S18 acetylase RimI-like enzyme